jgi:hypothetical protein
MQGDGEGPRADASLRAEVHPDADPAPGGRLAHPDAPEQPADGRRDAGRHTRMSSFPFSIPFSRLTDWFSKTQAMASMNRGMNLPQIQKIMNDFERESAQMDMKEEMMTDAIDDVMDDEVEDEEEEGNKILKEVLDEIGVDLSQQLTDAPSGMLAAPVAERKAVAIGETAGPASKPPGDGPPAGGGGGGGGVSEDDALQARLDALRRG